MRTQIHTAERSIELCYPSRKEVTDRRNNKMENREKNLVELITWPVPKLYNKALAFSSSESNYSVLKGD